MEKGFIFITMLAYLICFIVVQNYISNISIIQNTIIWVMIGAMNLLGYIEGRIKKNNIMETIKLELLAKDFEGTKFLWGDKGCAIEKAAKRHFKGAVMIKEGVDQLIIDEKLYNHDCYNPRYFNEDKELASTKSPDDVIRIIELFPA